ncbi:hypothetical protein AC579_5915 [Pseudocercospora musae]|uniref:Uncharacterized protein n=1 Tax=Pseudocercospora musae TaxID=113226 RepID=A0A139IT54_9PEZI|nr:hypothetical protein AC579_5915 [Pseudocercospora musae]
MAGIVPAGNLAVADPRMSAEADNLGTRRETIIKDTAPPKTHGHNTIYLDSSITFEAYDFYAARAREAEKHFTTESVVKQVSKVLVGKKVAKEQQPIDEDPTGTAEKDPKHESASPPSSGSDTAPGEDRFGVSETEWVCPSLLFLTMDSRASTSKRTQALMPTKGFVDPVCSGGTRRDACTG